MAMNGALNDAQTAAVASASPRTLVLAGAGTGKTMTLAYRVAALLADGWPPSSILALTFTRRAAAQMAERVASLAGPAALEEMWLGTIHAICYRVLCEHGHRIGYPEAPSVYGEEDAKAVLESVLTGLDLRCSLRQAGEAMRHGTADRDLRRAVAEYRRQLKVACAVDYDGLLTAALELLDIPEVRDGYRARFPHVLVDEVQDLFPASWSLLDKLAPEHLYLVGDDAQSIYGWLGASMDRLLALPGVGYAVHTLTRCYRCTRPVLALGNAILRQNARRLKKTLVTDKDGEPVCAKGFPDDEAEAAWVAAEAGRLYDGGTPWGAMAVLCRTNALAERLAGALGAAEVPVQQVGGLDPFATPAGRLVADVLRAAVHPHDEMALRRVLLAAGATPEALARLELDRHRRQVSLREAANGLPGASATRLVLALAELAASLAADGAQAARAVLAGLRRIPPLAQLGGGVFAAPILRALGTWRRAGGRTAGDLLVFLATKAAIDLWEPAEDAVTVATIHGVKGLEWPVVFVPGWEQGMLPHRAGMGSPEAVEEERRVAHVAVTRAADRLHVTFAAERREFSRVFRRVRSPLLDSLFEGVGAP